MSKLNANAFSFVPGQAFRNPQQPGQAPAQPPPAPIERPAQTEAPAPAPTISLNIGGSKPPAPPAAAPSQPSAAVPKPSTPAATPKPAATATPSAASAATKSAAQAGQASSTFSLGRAKTDTQAIEREVTSAVDEHTLKDLYGNGASSALTPI